jgi:hypothetical protein
MTEGFVPADFAPPQGLATAEFVLEPLGPQHNDSDYAAWTSSIEHIHQTPGYPDGRWPYPMPLEKNRHDLERHQKDFQTRKGFTYTVLNPDDRRVIGCVYIYPLKNTPGTAEVLSWVTAARAELDVPLHRAVSDWLVCDWPFAHVEYAPRSAN